MENRALHRPLPKERSISFANLPPGQAQAAIGYINTQDSLSAQIDENAETILVSYDLNQHSLEEIEMWLSDAGFHLDKSLLNNLIRALIYYTEEIEIHNLDAPRHLLKKSQHEAYTHAWEKHVHGDHDDTPPEWRAYR